MSDRTVLKAVCFQSKHVVARVVATDAGHVVRYRARVGIGYGNRFRAVDSEYRLNGPEDDPEVWITEAACPCGQPSLLTSAALGDAIVAGSRTVVLDRSDRPFAGDAPPHT